MPAVEVKKLTKRFVSGGGSVVDAVKNLNFSVNEGELFTLLGPSGCGKTTTLRALAGFEDITEGQIKLFGDVVSTSDLNVPPERRGIGFVFQSYAVWPHMTARENILYALKNQDYPKDRREDRVQEALSLVGLAGGNVEDRYPSELSGGQQQRVAFARAISYEPKLLLMDEPLSNLDFQLRKRMRQSILDILDEIKVTTVYVTHDQEEAFEISDDICVMKDGVKMQQGDPEALYDSPNSPFVANFIGEANVFNAELVSKTKTSANATITKGDQKLDMVCRHEGKSDLKNPVIVIRPERIHIEVASKAGKGSKYNKTSETNEYAGKITHKIFRGASVYYDVTIGDNTTVQVRSTQSKLKVGQNLKVTIAKQDALIVQGAS
tara:strand:- start:170 stop:1306 length:1137 start_codon:yes stop_codon:yes gene_type:complete